MTTLFKRHPLIPALLAVSLLLRGVIAVTYSGIWLPDEWYPTVELANLLVHGTAGYSPEIGAHARNLLWPTLLSAPLDTANGIAPGSIWLKLFLLQLLPALLDWAALLALLGVGLRRGWDARAQIAFVALAGLSWFALGAAIDPSAEHAAAVFALCAFGWFARPASQRGAAAAGFLGAWSFAAHYAGGFLVLAAMGLFLAARRDRARAKLWVLGVLGGLVVAGIPDAIHYGRPYESLWLTLAYAGFTPTPILPSLARFGIRLLPLAIFLASPALVWLWNKAGGTRLASVTAKAVAGVAIVGALVSLLEARGNYGTTSGSYLRAGNYLRQRPNTCLLITARPLVGALIPANAPVAQFNAEPEIPMSEQTASAELIYWQAPPSCGEGSQLLLNVDRFETRWENWGCTRLASAPPAMNGVWYECPPALVTRFARQRTEAPLVRTFGRFAKLPSYADLKRLTPLEISRLGERNVPPPECNLTCHRWRNEP